MAAEPKTNVDQNACVRCGEVLLGREPLCPHCQIKLSKALELAGQPGDGERRIVAVARLALLFAIVGAVGFLLAAGLLHVTRGSSPIPWTALGALAASTSFVVLVGPLSILESIRRAVSPGVRKLEATVGPSAGNRTFIVESPLGSLALLVVGDATLALYRAGARAAVDTRELGAVRAVEGGPLGSSALLTGEDASGRFGLLVFMRTRRPGNARRALARTVATSSRKQTRRDESGSSRPDAPHLSKATLPVKATPAAGTTGAPLVSTTAAPLAGSTTPSRGTAKGPAKETSTGPTAAPAPGTDSASGAASGPGRETGSG